MYDPHSLERVKYPDKSNTDLCVLIKMYDPHSLERVKYPDKSNTDLCVLIVV